MAYGSSKASVLQFEMWGPAVSFTRWPFFVEISHLDAFFLDDISRLTNAVIVVIYLFQTVQLFRAK